MAYQYGASVLRNILTMNLTQIKNRFVGIYKRYRDVIVIGLIVLVGLTVSRAISSSNELKRARKQLAVNIDSFNTWKDKAGREHGSVKLIPQNPKLLPQETKRVVEIKANILGVKPSDITLINETTAVTTGTITVPVVDQTVSYSDGYLGLRAHIYMDSTLETPLFKGMYTYRDTANFSMYFKKTRFLGITIKKEPMLDVYFNNPNTKIEGMRTIQLAKYVKPKRLGLGFQVGVTYSIQQAKLLPYVGVGFQYNLVLF